MNRKQYRDLVLDEESSRYFVVMDLVEGRNLRSLLLERRQRGFSMQETLDILMPVTKALDFAHERAIVHRDLKPENIMLGRSQSVGREHRHIEVWNRLANADEERAAHDI